MYPLFYFVLALTAILGANADGPVLDVEGNIIFQGSYYVLPFFSGRGGVTLAGRGEQVCPLDIVQASSGFEKGLPIKFSNWRSRVGFVPESEDLNIKTDVAATICLQSTYWQVGKFDQERKRNFLVAGSKPEGYGPDSIKTFFRIVKDESSAYKFVFCPEDLECRNVGIFIDEKGVRRLALSSDSEPLLVFFIKANVNELSTKNM